MMYRIDPTPHARTPAPLPHDQGHLTEPPVVAGESPRPAGVVLALAMWLFAEGGMAPLAILSLLALGLAGVLHG